MPSPAELVIVVLARAPVAGRVKTRLVPAVGAEGAAALHAAFVDDVCALTAGLSARRLLAAAGPPSPATGDAHLRAIAAREGMALVEQGEGDLGARMERLIAGALDGGASAVLLLGADSPMLPRAMVRRALALLDDAEVVIGPADDGGYWTIAARRPCPELFSDMPWGTSRVLAETRARLGRVAYPSAEAEPFWDVDEPRDLDRLRALLDGEFDPNRCPATRAALELCYLPRSS